MQGDELCPRRWIESTSRRMTAFNPHLSDRAREGANGRVSEPEAHGWPLRGAGNRYVDP